MASGLNPLVDLMRWWVKLSTGPQSEDINRLTKSKSYVSEELDKPWKFSSAAGSNDNQELVEI
jgi:hypothetical protein